MKTRDAIIAGVIAFSVGFGLVLNLRETGKNADRNEPELLAHAPIAKSSSGTPIGPDAHEPQLPGTDNSRTPSEQATENARSLANQRPAHATPRGRPRILGQSGPVTLADIPEGRFKDQLVAVAAADREAALTNLARLKVPSSDLASLHVSEAGSLFYGCFGEKHEELGRGFAAHTPEGLQMELSELASNFATYVPVSAPPVRESRPGAPNVIYLDFNGHVVSGTAWNTWFGANEFDCVPFDTDGDAGTFSPEEQAVIVMAWERVAEAFRPFDVNVTTKQPEVFDNRTAHALVTRASDVHGELLPLANEFTGLAWIGPFGLEDYARDYAVAFIYANTASPDQIGGVAAHEVAHNLGLSHDGSTTLEYYPGHGSGETSWAPIMGSPNKAMMQWSAGEYFEANNNQDDVAIIGASLEQLADDHADSNSEATPLAINGASAWGAGVVERRGDADRFFFATNPGTVSLTVTSNAFAPGWNRGVLDVAVELLDIAGVVIASAEPEESTEASIAVEVPAGTYFVRVRGAGAGSPLSDPPSGYTDYGSNGGYAITGTIIAGDALVAPAVVRHPEDQTAYLGTSATFTVVAAGNPATAYQWQSSFDAGASWSDLADGPSLFGSNSATLTLNDVEFSQDGQLVRCVVSNTAGTIASDNGVLIVGLKPSITTQPEALAVAPNSPATLTVVATGTPPLRFQWFKDGIAVPSATEAMLVLPSATLANVGDYSVVVSNEFGSISSVVARMNFTGPPAITVEPAPQMVSVGEEARFSVVATGTRPLSYHWQLSVNTGTSWMSLTDSAAYSGTGTSVLLVAEPGEPMSGHVYRCVVRNGIEPEAISSPAELNVVRDPRFEFEFGQAGASRTIRVDAPGEWTFLSSVPWIEPSIGSGSGIQNVEFRVADNTTGADRTGSIRLGGRTYTITQRSSGSGILGLWAMGNGSYGQLGDGAIEFRRTGYPVKDDVMMVKAGDSHSLFLTSDGTLWATGINGHGQLGDGTNTDRSIPVQVASGVVAASAGGAHSLFVKADGTLWATGNNTYGQLGAGTESSVLYSPVHVASNVADVEAGENYTLFLKEDGTLWAMGDNSYGQLGDGSTTNRSMPVQVASGVATMDAGCYHSLFVKMDGTLWAMGGNYSGQLGDGSTTDRTMPVQVASAVATGAAGYSHSMFVKTDGTLWATGFNWYGQLGNGGGLQVSTPMRVASGVSIVDAGVHHSVFVKMDGTLWAMGDNRFGQLGDGTTKWRHIPVQIASGVGSVAAGGYHNLIVSNDRVASAVGFNLYGQLGDGRVTSRSAPIQVTAPVSSVAGGQNHSLILKANGTLWAIGANSHGELGDGSSTDRSTPVHVANGVSLVAAGSNHTLFVKEDGTLWGMGYYLSGDPVSGQFFDLLSPVQIAVDVKAVAAGGFHSLFITADRALWAIGYNAHGQLGDGSTTDRFAPVQVASDVTAVAAGTFHSLFVKADGTLWAMGRNDFGQLGDGTTTEADLPVQVSSGISSVAAGVLNSLFLKTDGTLWGMGSNHSGQLGSGPAAQHVLPVQVASGVSAMTAGADHILFLKADGTLWGMGGNLKGQMGDRSVLFHRAPVLLAKGVVSAAAGHEHSLVVALDTVWFAPKIASGPADRTVTFGQSASFTVEAIGVEPLSYQWRKNGVDIDGATTATLEIANANGSDGGYYSVLVSYNGEGVSSDSALLTVISPLLITSNLAGQTVVPGGSVAYTVTSSGPIPLAYQWRLNGVDIPGATGATLRLTNVQPAQCGEYSVVVSTAIGSVSSNPVALSIDTTPRLINVSCRAFAGAGDNTLVMGFYISGTGSKTLLIRGVGPGLSDFIEGEVVADPRITVYRNSTPIDGNDDWDPTYAPTFSQMGAFALKSGSKDAAMVVTLPAGHSYTVHLVNDGPVAEGLIEVYDLSRDLGTRLTNVSCRLNMNAGQTVILGTALIGGPVSLLARNVGPGLAQYLVNPEDALDDPHLRLFRGDTEIALNDDWEIATRAHFGSTGAFDLPTGSKDAAIRVPFNPGGYTVHATGATGTSGIAIIELYESP